MATHGMMMTADAFHGLSRQSQDLVLALRQHRLLTSRQVWQLCMPDVRPNRKPGSGVSFTVAGALRKLRALGLADSVPSRLHGRLPAWFLTERGWEATRGMADDRPYRQTMAKARGASQLHTLGVNDVGIRFVREARARGDKCDALDWEHEVPHEVGFQASSLGRQTSVPMVITSDAALRYEAWEDGRLVEIKRWLIELDRSALTLARVRQKMEGYHQLYRHRARGGADWRERWNGAFPPVLWVVEGRPHHPAEMQLRSIATSARRESAYIGALLEAEGVALQPPVYLTTKEALMVGGPFAAIWRLLSDPAELRGLP